MELGQYAVALKFAGMDATFFPPDKEFDLERIDVSVAVEGFDEPFTIQVTQPPVADGAMHGLDLIQIFAPVPVILTDDQLDHMAYAITIANELSPLIGFSIREEPAFLFFRTLLLVPPGEIGLKVVVEGVSRTHYALDVHAASLIKAVIEEDDE